MCVDFFLSLVIWKMAYDEGKGGEGDERCSLLAGPDCTSSRSGVSRFSRFSGVKRNYIIVKRLGVGAGDPAKGSPPFVNAPAALARCIRDYFPARFCEYICKVSPNCISMTTCYIHARYVKYSRKNIEIFTNIFPAAHKKFNVKQSFIFSFLIWCFCKIAKCCVKISFHAARNLYTYIWRIQCQIALFRGHRFPEGTDEPGPLAQVARICMQQVRIGQRCCARTRVRNTRVERL